MPDPNAPIEPAKKRTRKPSSTKRVRKPKDPGILAIEAQAKAAKEEYRKSQASDVMLRRIVDKIIPKLTPEDRQALFDELSKTETPKVLDAIPGPGSPTKYPEHKIFGDQP